MVAKITNVTVVTIVAEENIHKNRITKKTMVAKVTQVTMVTNASMGSIVR